MDIASLRARIRPVAEDEGLRLVVLFGSAARAGGGGGGSVGADLDLAVDAAGLLDLVRMTNVFGLALERSDVDLANLTTADPVLLLSVAEEGIPLYEAEPGTFERFHSLSVRRFHDTRKFREMEHREIHERLAASGAGE